MLDMLTPRLLCSQSCLTRLTPACSKGQQQSNYAEVAGQLVQGHHHMHHERVPIQAA